MTKKNISNKNFVHLHVHSEFSTFDGPTPLSKLVEHARKMQFPALALTDHGNVGGLAKFVQHCQADKDKKGNKIESPKIKPILGVELYLSKDRHAHSVQEQPEKAKGNYHILLHAKNYKGYQNLCSLAEMAYTEGFYNNPRIDFDLLSQHTEGLICSTACLHGLVNANLYHTRKDAARKAVGVFHDLFKEDFYLEVMYHGMVAQSSILVDIFDISKEFNIPIIATNDVHYLTKDHALTHEAFMCVKGNKCIKDPKRVHFPYPELYLKSAQEMYDIWSERPEVLLNTLDIAEKIDDKDISGNLFASNMRLPEFEIPDGFKTPYEYLKHLAYQGLKKHGFDKNEKYIKRLEMELGDIQVAKENNNYDFATYLLIEWDVIKWARQNGIFTGEGRGSGFGSLLLRCLDITYGPDPVEHGLFWERFLAFENARTIQERDLGFTDNTIITLEDVDEEDEEEEMGYNEYE